MKILNGICTNQNQFKYMIEMDMYEVTIETVSHWALQKSVYNQHICNTYLTNNNNKKKFPVKQCWCHLKGSTSWDSTYADLNALLCYKEMEEVWAVCLCKDNVSMSLFSPLTPTISNLICSYK